MSASPFFIDVLDSRGLVAWQSFFKLFAANGFKIFPCRISKTELASLNVENVLSLVKAIQHFPIYLHAFVGSVDIQFSVATSENDLSFREQRMTADQIRWLHALNTVPVTLFFLRDFDHQFLVAAGDLLLQGNVTPLHLYSTSPINQNSGTELLLNQWALSTLDARLTHAARYFQLFCCHTGYDPADRIDEVFASFPVRLKYADIKKCLPRDILANKGRGGQPYIIQ